MGIHEEKRRKQQAMGLLIIVASLFNLLSISETELDDALDSTEVFKRKPEEVSSTREEVLFTRVAEEQNDRSTGISLPAFVYVLGRPNSGLCSQLLNFFATALYFKEFNNNRTMIADEATYIYRRNETVGVLRGFFTPQFPTIETEREQQLWIQPHLKEGHNYTQWRRDKGHRWRGDPADSSVLVATLYSVRSRLINNYNLSSVEFYEKMVGIVCPHLQFNEETKRSIAERKKRVGVPDFGDPTTKSSAVSFHIRRGDKVLKESKMYSGEEYVRKIKSVAPNVHFQHCFVATDDYSAISEVRDALSYYNMTCRLSTLTRPSELGHSESGEENYEATIHFLSELDSMIQTDYFVGTFSSNVGALVSILRGCKKEGNRSHYALSYGVDYDHWYLR